MAQVRMLLWRVVNWEQIPELHHLHWVLGPALAVGWDGCCAHSWVLCWLQVGLPPPPPPCAMLPSPAAVIYGCDLHSFYWKM